MALIFLDEVRLADGVARINELKERQPGLRVLVSFKALTADDVRAVLTAGADAFVARPKSARDLTAAILALAEGADCLVPTEPVPPAEVLEGQGLTPREAEVLRFLSAGFSNKEVAPPRSQRAHRRDPPPQSAAQDADRTAQGPRGAGPPARLAPVVDGEPVRRHVEPRNGAEDRSQRH